MYDEDRMKNAFGQADQAFKDNVSRTLRDLQDGKKENGTVRKTKITLLVAALFLILTTVAVAATRQLGIFDFITGYENAPQLLPEATGLVQKDFPGNGLELGGVRFSVREAIYDGQAYYVAIAGKPIAEKTMLTGGDMMPDYPVTDMGMPGRTTGTVRDYAKSIGAEKWLHANVYIDAGKNNSALGIGDGSSSMEFYVEEDGTFVAMIEGQYISDQPTVSMAVHCSVVAYPDALATEARDMDTYVEGSFEVALQRKAEEKTRRSSQSATYEDIGVRIDSVELSGTPMGLYYTIDFTVIDEEAYAKTDDGLFFEFIDAKGERLPDGPGGGSCGPVDEGQVQWRQTGALEAANRLPSQVTLRGYDCWSKDRFSQQTIQLQ